VTEYRLVSEPRADLDIEAAFLWYEKELSGLGLEFLDELRAVYKRIVEGPLKYPHLRSGVRRALVRRFPYIVYFAVEPTVIVVLAVLHASRDPAEWQRRIS
jgi:toxin ParE1/3/4